MRIHRIVFVLILLTEFAYGVYLGYFKNVLLGDAVSRTANAFYVLFCKPYRFTSIGLVWNPLPSVLQLPFVALAHLWRPIVTKGIGAAAVTALFAAWQGKTLLRTFELLKVERLPSLAITLLFCFNPYVFFYGANGMTEIIASAFSIQAICALSLWMRTGRASHLLALGVGCVGMFLTRYEAIPFALTLGFAMFLQMLFSQREKRYCPENNWKEKFFYMEGTMWVTFLPLIYTVLVWIAFNWIITGNPLYFLNSGYSMNAYSDYYTDYGGMTGAISYVWARVWPFLFALAGLLVVRLKSGTFLRYDTAVIMTVTLGLSVFQFFMIARGSSGGYVRYLCYPLMFAVAWMPYQLSVLKKAVRQLSAVVLCVVLALNGIYFAWALQHSSLMREDTLYMVPAHSEQVADYINTNLRDKRILMDSYLTYYAIMNVNNVDNLVISSTPDFAQAVSDPVGHNIDYVIVPQIGSYGNMDALNIAYPDLYWNGEEWCEEVTSIQGYKIFKVLK
jgi:hypothetical protein